MKVQFNSFWQFLGNNERPGWPKPSKVCSFDINKVMGYNSALFSDEFPFQGSFHKGLMLLSNDGYPLNPTYWKYIGQGCSKCQEICCQRCK